MFPSFLHAVAYVGSEPLGSSFSEVRSRGCLSGVYCRNSEPLDERPGGLANSLVLIWIHKEPHYLLCDMIIY